MEDKGSQDDKMSREVWLTVEASVRKIGIEKTKGRGSKKRERGEKAREEVSKEEKSHKEGKYANK